MDENKQPEDIAAKLAREAEESEQRKDAEDAAEAAENAQDASDGAPPQPQRLALEMSVTEDDIASDLHQGGNCPGAVAGTRALAALGYDKLMLWVARQGRAYISYSDPGSKDLPFVGADGEPRRTNEWEQYFQWGLAVGNDAPDKKLKDFVWNYDGFEKVQPFTTTLYFDRAALDALQRKAEELAA